ncbi:MAG: M48 family metalloprotease, partial [Proteobacteria bacterium]|nr:M48 family metalloprotease [Pseudomonadota bacterium]
EILCRLVEDYCGDIRFYIVRHPYFNASMGPNGAMQIWTGLLLRVQNEAQLAAVLGHELTHYLRRHTLQRWRDIRAKTDALIFFQLATAVAGVGIVGTFAQLAALGSIQAFTRDMEREADRVGFEMMTGASYDPNAAPKIWEMMIAEKEASNLPKGSIFFASHPTSEERQETIAKMAAEYDSDTAKLGRERFVEMTARYRGDWLRDELRQRDFGSLQVVLDYLMEAGANPGELHYFQGELHRLRGEEEEGDEAKAVEAYKTAIDTGAAPPEAHRALGLVYWSAGRKDEARGAFEAYIEVAPEAEDRAMVEYYLQQFE